MTAQPFSLWSRRRFLVRSAGALAVGTAGVCCVEHQAAAVAAFDLKSSPAPRSGDVPWLAKIQRPPERLPDDAPRLRPLLVDPEGRGITMRDAWETERKRLIALWREYLGAIADRRRVPSLDVVEEDRKDGVIRQLVRYEAEPGESTEAYLLRPIDASGQPGNQGGGKTRPEKRPGVVVMHSTVNQSIRQPSGVAVDAGAEKAFGLQLAKAGFVAFCPRNFLWPQTDKLDTRAAMERFAKRHPNAKGMAKMLYDAQVAVDILASQSDVDAKRLAAVGHSLGSKEALYLAAFDDRIRAAVASEGGVGTRFSNWDAAWYLGPDTQSPSFAREHHELVAMAAPRALLIVGGGTKREGARGDGADGDRTWPFVAAGLDVYRLYSAKPRLGLLNHHEGHSVPKDAAAKIEEWLTTYTRFEAE